jgi:hypothetical protein
VLRRPSGCNQRRMPHRRRGKSPRHCCFAPRGVAREFATSPSPPPSGEVALRHKLLRVCRLRAWCRELATSPRAPTGLSGTPGTASALGLSGRSAGGQVSYLERFPVGWRTPLVGAASRAAPMRSPARLAGPTVGHPCANRSSPLSDAIPFNGVRSRVEGDKPTGGPPAKKSPQPYRSMWPEQVGGMAMRASVGRTRSMIAA